MLRRLPSIFFDQPDNGRADDDAVRQTCHPGGLLRRGDAEADGAGNIRIAPDGLHNGCEVGFDLAPHAGHTERGYQIDEAFRFPGDPGNAVFGGGRDEGNQLQAEAAADGLEFFLFLIRDIRQNQSVHPDPAAGADKTLRPIGEHHVRIGHENHGHTHVTPQLFYKFKNLIRSDAAV